MRNSNNTQRLLWRQSKHDLEKIENLPARLGYKKTGVYRWHGHYTRYGYKKSLPLWKIVQISIESHIGKSVDEAYSYLIKQTNNCKERRKLDIHFRESFFGFDQITRYWYYGPKYILWDGKIQKRFSKITPKLIRKYITTNMVAYTQEGKRFDSLSMIQQWKYPRHLIKWVNEGDYIEFNDKTSEYRRWTAERQKSTKRSKREYKKALREKEYRMISEKEIREKQENLNKIIKHGFDPMTSFRK